MESGVIEIRLAYPVPPCPLQAWQLRSLNRPSFSKSAMRRAARPVCSTAPREHAGRRHRPFVVKGPSYAQKLTGINNVYAILGGFHLNGPAFEPLLVQTCDALTAF